MNGGSNKKIYAEESPKTRKAREKLKKQLDEVEKRITPQALAKKTLEIHQWIARHARHRVVLNEKNISLFDENQNAARLSSRVASIAKQLKEEIQKVPEPSQARHWHVDSAVKKVIPQDEATKL